MRRRFHQYKEQSAVVGKTSKNCSNFKVMNYEAMKQIKIASAKDRKETKLLAEKLQTSEGKFPVPKIFNACT